MDIKLNMVLRICGGFFSFLFFVCTMDAELEKKWLA